MMYLLLGLLFILSLYGVLMLMLMKLILSWRYKALMYGALTFFMLIAVFLIFSHYDNHWKHLSPSGAVHYTETV